MKKSLLEILRCPGCGKSLEADVTEASGDEVLTGTLVCTCGTAYPVIGGIPRMVENDAYVAGFSFEWNAHPRTQFDAGAHRPSLETFLQKTGLDESAIRDRLVLEAGCGTGRFMDVIDRLGGRCVGIDLSYAVEAAYGNVGRRPGLHVVQADIFNPPFATECFDVIYSLGVLHHTPDTKAAFLRLLPLLKPGGFIAVWLYDSYTPGQKINNAWRRLTTRMPIRLLYALCYLAIPLYYLKRIPLLGTFLNIVLPSSEHPDPRWRVLDTFDWYSPRYQHKHRYPEVFAWFQEAELEVVKVLEPPVAMLGRKRAIGPTTPTSSRTATATSAA